MTKRYVLYQSNMGDHAQPGYSCVPSKSVVVKVNGKDLKLVIDTGSDNSLLTPDGFHKLGLGPERVKIDGLESGFGGTAEAMSIHQVFTVMGKELPNMGVLMFHIGDNDGLMGMDVLAQFKRVTFDLEHKQLILED